jgi:hypothetical protein
MPLLRMMKRTKKYECILISMHVISVLWQGDEGEAFICALGIRKAEGAHSEGEEMNERGLAETSIVACASRWG